MSRFVQGRRVMTSFMGRFVQGRRVITSRVDHGYPDLRPKRELRYDPRIGPFDFFGRPLPRPIISKAIELLKGLTDEEKYKYGHVFSQLLGLPKPPEEPTTGTFAVKLVEYDDEKLQEVLKEIVWVKDTIKVVKEFAEEEVGASIYAMENLPSVIKEGISEEEADEIIAKLKAAGGVAVKEDAAKKPLE
ncbi:unnamed protein product [Microthlaspi erraticum]|uniref:Ribosomal protein L7/L12 C-terminal domain-containing protein n=1 Tax=Microthlaspi erraticum TaxID=1685480 RepID=A0A6D2KV15_9BRAS|nr:unnamed protein product [Microthlaspi erraticum]